jgi:hypothetical protein
MSGIRQRGIQLAVAVLVLVMGAGGSATGAGRTYQQAPKATVTNLQFLAGTDSDFPVRNGARALSASPVFAVTGAPLELDVSRSAGVVSIRQGGALLAVRPRSVLLGLPRYFQWKLLRSDGTVAASAEVDACPMPGTEFSLNAWGFNLATNLDPANPSTPAKFPYSLECGDPLTTRARWGFPNGWGVQVHIQVPDSTPAGPYVLDATVNPDGAIREATRADNHVQMPVEVLDISEGPLAQQAAAERQNFTSRAMTQRSTAPASASSASVTSADAGEVDLPDLVPLPSENIAARHQGDADLLRFNSTMTNLGRGRLQVDGFRRGAPAQEMQAYQVLFHNGVEMARRPAGALVYDPEHLHWHFDYLARYQLVDARGAVVASSGKVGFCMADVHQIDASTPNFVVPDFLGLTDCGTSLSQSVREMLDAGWGDEYDQITPGQALDISTVPNGTYRIQILADPEQKLREATRDNNVSYRTVILGGKPGARTAEVPPVDGVDTDAAWAALVRRGV